MLVTIAIMPYQSVTFTAAKATALVHTTEHGVIAM